MEIFKRHKNVEIKNLIKNLSSAKIGDPNRLDSIMNSLDQGNDLFFNDKEYLAKKFRELEQLQKNQFVDPEKEQTESNVAQHYIKIIQRLQQKEIGNFSRLESISNYLLGGNLILTEDEAYLKEKNDLLIKTESRGRDSKPQTILIDDFEKKPTHDFDSLSHTISNIVRNSHPHFTIGIYGEWGTGKTTLMRAIERNLKDEGVSEKEQKILNVWLNAWKYEREENLATMSLMRTVAYAMADHEKFDSLSKTIFRGLTIFGKDLMQQLAIKIISKKSNELEEELTNKMDYMNKLYRESVYFDGLDKIKRQMERIRESEDDKEYRVVVFIDDLDRCSPNKALEILESIKLFLDMDGFTFIIGLSHKTVTRLISHEYNATGVRGEDYIKKIIQIPIKIPQWPEENIIDLIKNKIAANLNEEYTEFLLQNSGMVAKVVEYNPRQLKRFINNVIIAFETFANQEETKGIKFNEIFLVKILRKEWPEFYEEFFKNEPFREAIKWIISKPKKLGKYFKYLKAPTDEHPIEQKEKRQELLKMLPEQTNGQIDAFHIDILSDFTYSTWNFIDNVKAVLFGVENWKVLNSVIDVVEEFSYDLKIGKKPTTEQENQTQLD